MHKTSIVSSLESTPANLGVGAMNFQADALVRRGGFGTLAEITLACFGELLELSDSATATLPFEQARKASAEYRWRLGEPIVALNQYGGFALRDVHLVVRGSNEPYFKDQFQSKYAVMPDADGYKFGAAIPAVWCQAPKSFQKFGDHTPKLLPLFVGPTLQRARTSLKPHLSAQPNGHEIEDHIMIGFDAVKAIITGADFENGENLLLDFQTHIAILRDYATRRKLL